jgi:hypothetical protein
MVVLILDIVLYPDLDDPLTGLYCAILYETCALPDPFIRGWHRAVNSLRLDR